MLGEYNRMIPSGPAIYFDGVSSARHDVLVELADAALRIVAADGRAIAEWPYAELRRHASPDRVLRIGRARETALARIEVRHPHLAAEIAERAVTLDRSGSLERRTRLKVVAWSFAAMVSLVTAAIFGVPALATRIAPYVPLAVEQRLGGAVDKQILSALDTRRLGANFTCGEAASERASRAALDKLVGKLEAAAGLPMRLRVVAVRRPEPNAFAIPGGRIYLYEGLIGKAENADELAAALAHEIGHVVRRDGTRTVLQAAGLSFLFGLLLGDFVGGGAVVIAAKTVLRSAYSRKVEAAADAYGVELMRKVGGDPRALGRMLARVVSDKTNGLKILHDHPDAKDRIAAINTMAAPGASTPLLDADEWRALKRICSEQTAGRDAAAHEAVRADDGTTSNR
jgi:Zn-dependent protease with chaperone function